MAEDNDSDDQLDEFIHSYSYSDHGARNRRSSDEEDTSYSDSGSEPPEDPSAEAEDMELYDLYANSAHPSPQPPDSPMLQGTHLELDPVIDSIVDDSKSEPPKRQKHAHDRHVSFAPSALKPGDANPVVVEDSSESDLETSDDEKGK